MNISQIKAKPISNKCKHIFKDYNVAMIDLIEERWIKNWIDKLQMEPDMREKLLKESALIRVRYDDNGEIYEMMAHQNSYGHMGCMFYREEEDWEALRKIIEMECKL